MSEQAAVSCEIGVGTARPDCNLVFGDILVCLVAVPDDGGPDHGLYEKKDEEQNRR
jgi:hypothetical protein